MATFDEEVEQQRAEKLRRAAETRAAETALREPWVKLRDLGAVFARRAPKNRSQHVGVHGVPRWPAVADHGDYCLDVALDGSIWLGFDKVGESEMSGLGRYLDAISRSFAKCIVDWESDQDDWDRAHQASEKVLNRMRAASIAWGRRRPEVYPDERRPACSTGEYARCFLVPDGRLFYEMFWGARPNLISDIDLVSSVMRQDLNPLSVEAALVAQSKQEQRRPWWSR